MSLVPLSSLPHTQTNLPPLFPGNCGSSISINYFAFPEFHTNDSIQNGLNFWLLSLSIIILKVIYAVTCIDG